MRDAGGSSRGVGAVPPFDNHLGQAGLSVQGSDLNAILGRQAGAQVRFQRGCFVIHVKLPIGLGVTLVAIPESTEQTVIFHIPFEQIKGDRTGGVASFLAGGLWGVVKPQIEKTVRKNLSNLGMSPDTVTLDQGSGAHGKVGMLVLHLNRLNSFLLRNAVQGFRVSLDSLWVTEEVVNLVFDVFRPKGPVG